MGNHVLIREDISFLLGSIKAAIEANGASVDDPIVYDYLRKGSDDLIDLLWKSHNRDAYDDSINIIFKSFENNSDQVLLMLENKYTKGYRDLIVPLILKIKYLHHDIWCNYPRPS